LTEGNLFWAKNKIRKMRILFICLLCATVMCRVDCVHRSPPKIKQHNIYYSVLHCRPYPPSLKATTDEGGPKETCHPEGGHPLGETPDQLLPFKY